MNGHIDLTRQLDQRLARPMFGLALLVLALFASLIYLNDLGRDGLVVWWSLAGLALLYPVFWLETAVHYYLGSGFLRQHLWFCVLPITRIGARDHETGKLIWLPGYEWREVDKSLERLLARRFGVPMIVISLMVLPIIGMEFFYKDFVDSNPGWRVVMSIAEAFIWAAFTFEFILMVKIVRSKAHYAIKHWIDLAVILLPTLAFMRMMRLASVGRLNQLSRTARIFRLRGLAMRLWRAFVALDLIEHLLALNPEWRLEKLEDQLQVKMEEIGYLNQDIERLREKVRRKRLQQEAARQSEQDRVAGRTPTPLDSPQASDSPSEPSGNRRPSSDPAELKR